MTIARKSISSHRPILFTVASTQKSNQDIAAQHAFFPDTCIMEIVPGFMIKMKTSGFTLIEVMTTLAVIAVLAAIALPSYTSYVQRGKITEATNQLATTRVQLEQYYQDNKNYGSSESACGNHLGTSSGDYFDFSCSSGADSTDQSFIATATGKDSMAGFTYTIDSSNARTTVYPGVAGTQSCWLFKASDTC